MRLLDAVAIVADELNHHPDVRLGWGRVSSRSSRTTSAASRSRDVDLALRIGALADEQGAAPA